jgi:hypothetical protein
VELEARTSGGSEDGNALCTYDFELHSEYTTNPFANTGGKIHKQSFTALRNGDYSILASCIDSGRNIAEERAVFSLKVDKSAPVIIRAFNQGNQLRLISDEGAQCYYSNDRIQECNFNTDDATQISSTFSTTHNLNWDKGKTYFVKCKDVFETTNQGCAIRVNPA